MELVTRALVLGGGGAVGIGWQAGLITGLADEGVALRGADVVVGTSAGSVVGAQLTSDRALADVVTHFSHAPPWMSSDVLAESPDLSEMFASAASDTVSEEEYVAEFAFLSGTSWPETFRCTAVDVDSGRFAVWDQATGVEVHRAVASSCSLPGLVPPVTIAGGHYIDGGARDMLNVDVVIGHDVVLAVSCVALDPAGGLVPELLAGFLPDIRTRLEEVRSTGSAVKVIEPSAEVQTLSGSGRYLMDHSRTEAAFEAGVRQGKAESAQLGPFWSV
jgi:NTE family protein